jgi:hypothetical protein
MKTLKIWMFGLLLPAIAIAPACEKDDDDGDDGADDGGDDDGGDDGGDDDGGDDDGGDSQPPGDDDGGDTFPDDDGGDTFPDDDGGDTFPDDDGGDTFPDDDGGDDDGGDEGPTGGAVGDQCTSDADCADNACLFAGDVDYGFCSKVCESFADCPSFWECEPVGNASANYCVPSE